MITDENTIILIRSMFNVNKVYKRGGLHIYTIHVYGKFDTYHIISEVVKLNVTLKPVSEDGNYIR